MRDPYVYENSEVLINIKEIKDKKKLDEFESRIVSISILKLFIDDFKIKSLSDVFDIHKILFEKVYSWAGSPRTIDIEKPEPILDGLSVEYCYYRNINKEIEKLDDNFKKEKWNEMSKQVRLDKIIYYFSSLWKIHPFREGNTRTISTMLKLFVSQIGLKLNNDILRQNVKFFRNALVLASIGEYSEPEHLKRILGDALYFKKPNAEDYTTINDYKLDKYSYSNHKVKNK